MITFYNKWNFQNDGLDFKFAKKYASRSFELTRGQKPLENVQIRSYLNYDNDSS